MAWIVGEQYRTRGAQDAFIRWQVGIWIGGYVLPTTGNAAPIAVRWNGNNGTSDAGQSFALLPPQGSFWVATFFTRRGDIGSATADTEQEARDIATGNGNQLISVTEVTP